jgi:hypothetical protein
MLTAKPEPTAWTGSPRRGIPFSSPEYSFIERQLVFQQVQRNQRDHSLQPEPGLAKRRQTGDPETEASKDMGYTLISRKNPLIQQQWP